MIKSLTFTILLLFKWSTGFTQSREEIDSLQRQLAIAKDDTTRINAQISLCYSYRLGNNDSSLFYGQQALKLSQEVNYPAGEILAFSFMSVITGQTGNLPKALEMAFKALQIAKANKLERLSLGALDGIGKTYITLKDYPRALNYLRQLISISKTYN